MSQSMRSTRTARLPFARSCLALALVGALIVPPRSAAACGGEWYPALMDQEPDLRPKVIPLAEKALEQGRVAAAAGIVIRVIPHIKTLKPQSSSLVERAARVLAVAVTRSGGKLPVESEVPSEIQDTWLGKTAKDRAANLQFAARTLSAISDLKKDDPAVQTELAEALAQLPESRARALALLEDLARRDLVASAEGYAALAQLRARAGDASGGQLALARCQSMSKAKAVCSSTLTPAS
ncbi:MAG TPA: hypothetical protein VFQ61_03395 [Polyangiaceae bacterium]|nr:hypothetical protein [Polyangiaceae bacterium]